MGFFKVLKAEWIRSFIIMRRYWFSTLTGIIMGYGMLIVLIYAFFTNREQIDEFARDSVEKILGLIIGMFASGIVGMFSSGLQGMARAGQLEQVCMSPHGLITNFLARTFVSAVNAIISSSILLTLVAFTVKGELHPDPIPTLILLSITYLNLIGFGFLVGGMVLVFKDVGKFTMMLRFGLLGMALFASEKIYDWPSPAREIAHILPVTDAALSLKYVLVDGQQRPVLDENGDVLMEALKDPETGESVWVDMLDENGDPILDASTEEPIQEIEMAPVTEYQSVFSRDFFYYLIANAVLWTFLGITCFRVMETWSRDKGTLGTY